MNVLNWAYDAWMGTNPAVREPIRSAVVSGAFTVYTSVSAWALIAYSQGDFETPEKTVAYLHTSWWALLLAVIFNPAAPWRARQAAVRVANTVALPNPVTLPSGVTVPGGAEAVVTKPAAP